MVNRSFAPLVVAFSFAACAGSDDGSADATTSSDTGGTSEDSLTTVGSMLDDGASTGAPTGPTFAEDVAPILAEHCWSCHIEGGVAPFTLVAYDEVAALGGTIVSVTESRVMPPWPLDATGGCQSFVDERWLSDEEIATLAAWVDAGTLPGDLALVPDPPQMPPGLEEVSATLAIEPYMPQGSPPENPLDDYRCFVVDPQIASDTVLTAFEVHPGVAEQAHHIVLYSIGTPEAQAEAIAMSGADGRPGYQCFGGAGLAATELAGAWAPGVRVARFPAGTGAPLPGGRMLVLQMHYNLAAGAELDATSVDVQFDPTATPLRGVRALDLDLAIPPDTENHVESVVDSFGAEPVVLVAAFPHMHQLGRTLRMELEDGTCVIDVPRWDFHWQQTYSYQTPLTVPAGASFTLECAFDSTGKSEMTAWGEGTSDEMCVVQFFALP